MAATGAVVALSGARDSPVEAGELGGIRSSPDTAPSPGWAQRERDRVLLQKMVREEVTGSWKWREKYRSDGHWTIDQVRATRANDLRALQKQAEIFRSQTNLGPALNQAANVGDAPTSAAIFLEWYRRDPAEAFAAIDARPALFADPYSTSLTTALSAVQTDDIVAYLQSHQAYRISNIRIANRFVEVLAEKDGLGDLQKLSESDPDPERLIRIFKSDWRSSDPKSDARTIAGSPFLMEQLLPDIFEFANPSSLDLQKALMELPWPGREQEKEERMKTWSSLQAAERLPRQESEPPSMLTRRMKNHAALVFSGRMSLAEAIQEMQAHELGNEDICEALFPAEPEEAAKWGLSHEVTTDQLTGIALRTTEPGEGMLRSDARNMVRLEKGAAEIERQNPGSMSSFNMSRQSGNLGFWQESNPQAAGEAMKSLPPAWAQKMGSYLKPERAAEEYPPPGH